MKTSDFDYSLPPHLIAQSPVEPRDCSRLLVVSRADGSLEHRHFHELPPLLRRGDVLVLNDTRVIPARLVGRRRGSGGKVELLLLRRVSEGVWEALSRPARRLRRGAVIELEDESGGPRPGAAAEVVDERGGRAAPGPPRRRGSGGAPG